MKVTRAICFVLLYTDISRAHTFSYKFFVGSRNQAKPDD